MKSNLRQNRLLECQDTQFRAVRIVSLVYIRGKTNLALGIRTCSLGKTDFSDTVEICWQGIYIDVSQTKHVIMQMKTPNCMLKVNTKVA